MRITDAPWEKRNTGLRVCEVKIDQGEGIEECAGLIPQEGYDYVVVKVPAGDNRMVHYLENAGYRYLENQFNIRFCSQEADSLNGSWGRRFSDHRCAQVNERGDIERITARIRRGLFEKDRFSTDPVIAPGIPDNRIAGWVEDIHTQGKGAVYTLFYKGEEVGFFILSERRNHIYVEMAGIFREHRGSGLPFLLLYNILKESAAGGYHTITASVSSNNLATLNTFTRFIRFRIDSEMVVLRKYFEKE